jgi:transcriptional regulator with GAF, ATPase, and Fis domain
MNAALLVMDGGQKAEAAGAGPPAGDARTLLRVSAMLHSFHAMYNGRGSSVRNVFEEHLLSLILETIPASRGAILFYEGSLDEPSPFSIEDAGPRLRRPLTIDRPILERVIRESCALLVDACEREPGSEGMPSCALLAAPLVLREHTCGVIYLEGEAFSEAHLETLTAVADLASMAMENAYHLEWLETERARLETQLHPDGHMIGDSDRLRELQRNIARAAQTNSTVLITGETGTGKELVARAIHRNSCRADRPFVAVNCAALAETLLESELFGHEKGAFTGAVAQKKGRLELAGGGTMFLDELGEMPLPLQAKLLRVLQERQMERVGGTRPIRLDIRLIAATNRNLEEEVRAGRFRQDLYYRLNVVVLKTPALRERPSDILPLAMHFAARFSEQCGRRISGISPEAQAYLSNYDWPGNIRELENAIERAVVLGAGDMIALDDLPDSIREIAKPARLSRTFPLQDAVGEAKRQAVARAFDEAKGDHGAAAELLGVHPNYLYRLMRNLGLR